MRRLAGLRAIAALGILVSSPAYAGADTAPQPIRVECRAISGFRAGSNETRFGPLTFVGGLEMTSPDKDFGSFSAFRFRSPGDRFAGLSDTGFWYSGRVSRDAAGRPACFAEFRMQRVVDVDGMAVGRKSLSDAEGLDIRDGTATATFERAHRVSEYDIAAGAVGPPQRDIPFLVPPDELRYNKGFETVVYAPQDGPLQGARIAIAERSVDEAGNCFGAILEGPEKGVFTVARHDGFDITDGAFLPDGDLLLLERRYSWVRGVAMRLRRIAAETIRKGGVANGPVLLTAVTGHEIDNMEGLDVWRRDDGATMVSLVSDDNQSSRQRNLYLEFVLDEE